MWPPIVGKNKNVTKEEENNSSINDFDQLQPIIEIHLENNPIKLKMGT